MTTESISFIAVLDRYILYSETFSQYLKLEEEDKKIIEPYLLHLKNLWMEALALIKIRTNTLSSKATRLPFS